MQTRLLEADDHTAIATACKLLHAGEVVAFPTETVYGLGANALDPAAVAKIYRAKGRPAVNPLIVHVGAVAHARTLVREWRTAAEQLVVRFWPGPLSIILPKASVIPEIITAGSLNVALRMPNHPVALQLLQNLNFPLAAPSANPSNRLSPTTAQHVLMGLGGRIPLVIDGGPTSGGIESTVVDLSSNPPRLLRLGPIALEDLQNILPDLVLVDAAADIAQPLASPGLLARHYCPQTPLICMRGFAELAAELARSQAACGVITFSSQQPADNSARHVWRCMTADPVEYARGLYAVLHDMDQLGLSRILLELPPPEADWAAVCDRLRRAASDWRDS